MKGTWLLVVIILIGVIFVLSFLRKKIKTLTLPCVFFVSGAVKSGKTLLSVHLAIKEYKRALLLWRIKKFFRCLIFPLKFKDIYRKVAFIINESQGGHFICDDELKDYFPPMLYSNIPLATIKFNKVTLSIIKREVRIPNKSVVLLDEVSLMADSMLFKDENVNNALMSFYKLFGHYSHGGKLILDSQSMQDNHFSAKRCMNSFLYIFKHVKYPFISVLFVRELMNFNDGSSTNTFNEDVELTTRKVVIFNSTYDKYDCYCFSVFTDYLPLKVCYSVDVLSKKDDLKCYNIITLNDFVTKLNDSIRDKYPQTTIIVNDDGVVKKDA